MMFNFLLFKLAKLINILERDDHDDQEGFRMTMRAGRVINVKSSFSIFQLTKLALIQESLMINIIMMTVRRDSVWRCGLEEPSRREQRSPTAMLTLRWLHLMYNVPNVLHPSVITLCTRKVSLSWMNMISQDPVLVRQELLKMGKFFHCSCSRLPIGTRYFGAIFDIKSQSGQSESFSPGDILPKYFANNWTRQMILAKTWGLSKLKAFWSIWCQNNKSSNKLWLKVSRPNRTRNL